LSAIFWNIFFLWERFTLNEHLVMFCSQYWRQPAVGWTAVGLISPALTGVYHWTLLGRCTKVCSSV